MENYLVINGKRVDFTEEQIKQLGLEVEKKSPFDRVDTNKTYWYIHPSGRIDLYLEREQRGDKDFFNAANYCTDKALLTERAKEEVLSRLLWRFSMENGGSEIDWENKEQKKYYFYKNPTYNGWEISYTTVFSDLGVVYFISVEVAARAIDEIVKPFYAGELEVCKIWEE